MSAILEQVIRRIAEEVFARAAQGRMGSVVAINPNPPTPLVKVQWDEGDPANGVPPSQSGWLPLGQGGAASGAASVTLPTIGTQVFCQPNLADHGSMVVTHAVHSEQAPAPQIVPYGGSAVSLVPGEPTFVHASGASLRVTSGRVEINGDLYVNGNVVAMQQISDLNQQHGSLNLLRTDYDEHEHTGVQPGGGTTGPTTMPTP